jgi:hypothetical protein
MYWGSLLYSLFRPFQLTCALLLTVVCACRVPIPPPFPQVKVSLPADSIPEEGKRRCEALLISGSHEMNVPVSIERRGSSSKSYPKRSYSIRFRTNKEDNADWMGHELSGDWILYGPYADRTCIRNALAHEMYRRMGHYSPRSLFVELYLGNGYRGLYELREKISLSPRRMVGATHILKFDKPSATKRTVKPSKMDPAVPILLHDSLSGSDTYAAYQAVFRFEEALQAGSGDWLDDIDLESFLDYFLISEWADSPDAYRSSTYIQVLSDGRLRMGPLWDYDLAFGNSPLSASDGSGGWRFEASEAGNIPWTKAPPWWSALIRRNEFRRALSLRWESLRRGIFSDRLVDSLVEELAAGIEPALKREHGRWKAIGKTIPWTMPPKASYGEELLGLKGWLRNRSRWMDSELMK